MSTPYIARRSFARNASWTGRVMEALATQHPAGPATWSMMLDKHCPAVLLALAAHHDVDGRDRMGYGPTQLVPFVGLSEGLIATALRRLMRDGFVTRYKADNGGFRYLVSDGAVRS